MHWAQWPWGLLHRVKVIPSWQFAPVIIWFHQWVFRYKLTGATAMKASANAMLLALRLSKSLRMTAGNSPPGSAVLCLACFPELWNGPHWPAKVGFLVTTTDKAFWRLNQHIETSSKIAVVASTLPFSKSPFSLNQILFSQCVSQSRRSGLY